MHRHLVLLIAISPLLVSWFIKYYDYPRMWIAHFRSQPSVAYRKRENKGRQCHPPSSVTVLASNNARAESSIMVDWEQDVLVPSRKGEKCAFDAEMTPSECKTGC